MKNTCPLTPRAHRVLVLIPALNESATVAQVVASVRRQQNWDVLVVDDASDDDTAAAARHAGASVAGLSVRQGAWGALQTGFQYSVWKHYGIVVTMDADGQHEVESLPDIVEPILSGIADTAIGVCAGRGSIARKLGRHLIGRLSGLGVSDVTSGFRAYNRTAIEKLLTPGAALLSYQDVGVLMLLQEAGSRLVEVPVPMKDRVSGESRIYDSWRAIATYLSQTVFLCVAKFSRGWTSNSSTKEFND